MATAVTVERPTATAAATIRLVRAVVAGMVIPRSSALVRGPGRGCPGTDRTFADGEVSVDYLPGNAGEIRT
ncbi:hypothetical protein GCM10010505_49540 [Kitasatospora aburaviensis]